MRITCLTLILLLVSGGLVHAVAPVNADNITTALDYGRIKASVPLAEFYLPWTVYEEKTAKLDEKAERAYIYTPFLLLAADARDKSLNGQPVKFTDSEKVLTDYNGYLIFGVVLYGQDPQFIEKLTVTMKQGKRTIGYSSLTAPPVAEKTPWSTAGSPVYMAQCYVYFLQKEISLEKPAILTLNSADRGEHNFYFNLVAFR